MDIKKAIRVIVVVIILALLIVGYYYHLSKKDFGKNREDVELTEAQKIITKDFEKYYPSSPRAVVKWYNRIAICLYNRDYEDRNMKAIARQERMLLDKELIEQNPDEIYLAQLQSEKEQHEERDESIIDSKVCDSNEVVYRTVKGDECAYVTSYYFGKVGNNYTRTYQEFVLRKDKYGRWKILSFRLIQGDADRE